MNISLLFSDRDFGHAADLFSRTVEKFATPMAANRLGQCYEHGNGVPQNYEQVCKCPVREMAWARCCDKILDFVCVWGCDSGLV